MLCLLSHNMNIFIGDFGVLRLSSNIKLKSCHQQCFILKVKFFQKHYLKFLAHSFSSLWNNQHMVQETTITMKQNKFEWLFEKSAESCSHVVQHAPAHQCCQLLHRIIEQEHCHTASSDKAKFLSVLLFNYQTSQSLVSNDRENAWKKVINIHTVL